MMVALAGLLLAAAAALPAAAGECLASGICLPEPWPPTVPHSHNSGGQQTLPPYLTSPPATINVSTGRQLFVDSFLVDEKASQNLATVYGQPVYRDDVNPVLKATERWEFGFTDDKKREPAMDFATPYSGGMFWDPEAQHYKLWYSCGSPKALESSVTCLATSPVRTPPHPTRSDPPHPPPSDA